MPQGNSRRYGRTDEIIEERLREELDLIGSKGSWIIFWWSPISFTAARSTAAGKRRGEPCELSSRHNPRGPHRHKLLFGRFSIPSERTSRT